MSIVSVYAVFASEAEARRIGRMVVEERLAACANILGTCHSVYRWEGQVKEDSETPVILKTAADRAEALIARIAELHSYDVPAAVAWPIDASHPPYAAWVLDETRRA